MCIDSPFFSTQDSTSTYPNNYHGDHLRIRIPRTVQSNMRGRSRLGSFRSELGIGEIDAQGTCGGSRADMDWCAYCFSLWSVLSGSVLFFFFPSDHISPSFLPSLMSLTYLQQNQAHQESLREILHPRPCVPMDNRQMYSKAVFFTHFHVSHISSLLPFPSTPPRPSPPKKTKKKKKKINSQKQTAPAAPTAPSHKPLPQQSHKPSPQKPTEIH